MSTAHLLVVTCDRCGASEQIDPVPLLVARHKSTNPNYSADQAHLFDAAEMRPARWGRFDITTSPDGRHWFGGHKGDLCPGCVKEVSAHARSKGELKDG